MSKFCEILFGPALAGFAGFAGVDPHTVETVKPTWKLRRGPLKPKIVHISGEWDRLQVITLGFLYMCMCVFALRKNVSRNGENTFYVEYAWVSIKL